MKEPLLSRVLFAQDTYIVPKADGRIVVGATVEAGSFDPNVTPAGLMHCMANAMQLVPGLGELPVEETWAGLRPTTPDKGPILGRTKWDNLFIAGGYWRNGVLLAPKTGQLVGDLVIRNGDKLEEESDEKLLEAFHWDRFTELGSGKKMAANARYAASMHPVHKRSSGMGVAAAVGTELGFYSGAKEAAQERQKDRQALFQNSGISSEEDSAFEKAAKLGISDASTFDFGPSNMNSVRKAEEPNRNVADEPKDSSNRLPFDGSLDALTVGIASSDEVSNSSSDDEKENGLESVYESIRQKKAKAATNLEMNKVEKEERPDPGFRVYYIDEDTGEYIEIPPYTSPPHIFSNKATNGSAAATDDGQEEKGEKVNASAVAEIEEESQTQEKGTTYDGYQAIQQANSRASREDELEAMKTARLANRAKASDINESRIGVKKSQD
jgi:Glycine/D-amino acid oxidases (deaminating)